MEQRFDIPLGPSVNQMFPGKNRRYKSGQYRSWLSTAGWHIRASRPSPLRMIPYTVRILVPQAMRGDPDNRIKAVLDLLVRNGVTPDDKHAHRVSVERSTEAYPGRCIVYVAPFANGAEDDKPTEQSAGRTGNPGGNPVREPDPVAGEGPDQPG